MEKAFFWLPTFPSAFVVLQDGEVPRFRCGFSLLFLHLEEGTQEMKEAKLGAPDLS